VLEGRRRAEAVAALISARRPFAAPAPFTSVSRVNLCPFLASNSLHDAFNEALSPAEVQSADFLNRPQ